MMAAARRIILLVGLWATVGYGQPSTWEPDIGYIYPAGGKQGTSIVVAVGGQRLRNTSDVYITGAGVHAKVIKQYRGRRNLPREQAQLVMFRLQELGQKRWARMARENGWTETPPWQKDRRWRRIEKPDEEVEWPELPLLFDLENKSLRELVHIRHRLFDRRRDQPNAQIAETVLIQVSIGAKAPPGDRELRLGGRRGFSNPLVFQVGVHPEVCELEQNDPGVLRLLPDPPPFDLPVLINGQVAPGDVDRFRFAASKGQKLLIEAQARRLIPFLADTVPGWFQATLTLYDEAGNEAGFADDFRFDPDPVMFFDVPEDGVYEVDIRDSIYRGRDDFVYRLTIREGLYVTDVFPLGGKSGARVNTNVQGWNVRKSQWTLDCRPGIDRLRHTRFGSGTRVSNEVAYTVDDLYDSREVEPNDDIDSAQRVSTPRIVNGRISTPQDVDVYEFRGRAGQEIVASVVARRVHSPLDALVRLCDKTGAVLAWNDDAVHKDGHLHTDMGLLTHHADAYVRATLPSEGMYYVQVADALQHGGPGYAYRVRISPPRPDFVLHVTPSTLNPPPGRCAVATVHALRQDGFDGPIALRLKNPPRGYVLDGGLIPPGCNRIRVTLTAPGRRQAKPRLLTMEGHAARGRDRLVHTAIPADEVMQAFLWRHLVAARQLIVASGPGRRRAEPMTWTHDETVSLPAGGRVALRVNIPGYKGEPRLVLELNEPPKGVTIEQVGARPDGLAIVIAAHSSEAQIGLRDNLIIDAYQAPSEDAEQKNARRRHLGILPALPIEIVAP